MAVRGVSTVRQTTVPPQSAGYVGPPRQPVFSRPFEVVESIDEISPPFVFILSGHLVRMVAVLGTAGTEDTVISVILNNVEIATITILAGQDRADIQMDQPFSQFDKLQVSVVSGGTNAFDLTVIGDPR